MFIEVFMCFMKDLTYGKQQYLWKENLTLEMCPILKDLTN